MLVRKDLPQTTQLVQAAHATCEAGRQLVSPTAEHPHFVVLGVPNESSLLSSYNSFKAAGLSGVLFRENDLGDAATACALGPISGPTRRLFRGLPLLNLNTEGDPTMTDTTTTVVTNASGVTCYKSRWGYHAVDLNTFKKLKLLNRLCWEAYWYQIYVDGANERWSRKQPQNRVSRKRIRNDKGQVIGYESPVPIPEPVASLTGLQLALLGSNITQDFNTSRMPAETPDKVNAGVLARLKMYESLYVLAEAEAAKK